MRLNSRPLTSFKIRQTRKNKLITEKAVLDRSIKNNFKTLAEEEPDWDVVCAHAAGLATKVGMANAANLMRHLADALDAGMLGSTPQ